MCLGAGFSYMQNVDRMYGTFMDSLENCSLFDWRLVLPVCRYEQHTCCIWVVCQEHGPVRLLWLKHTVWVTPRLQTSHNVAGRSAIRTFADQSNARLLAIMCILSNSQLLATAPHLWVRELCHAQHISVVAYGLFDVFHFQCHKHHWITALSAQQIDPQPTRSNNLKKS